MKPTARRHRFFLPATYWAGIGVAWAVWLAAFLFFGAKAELLNIPLVFTLTLLISFQRLPRFWRDGENIVFANPLKKILTEKRADSELASVVEWDGYDGPIYDIIWKDGETWTFPYVWGISLASIAQELKKCGVTEVPTQKDWLIYRPKPPEEQSRPGPTIAATLR